MADFEIGNLIYLVVLGGVLLGSVLLSRRNEVSKVLKEAGIWVILFVVVIAVVAGWQDIRTAGGQFSSNVTEQGEIIIPQQRDGHYHLTLSGCQKAKNAVQNKLNRERSKQKAEDTFHDICHHRP